ncbi:DUF1573 domain-containing protein [Candidatus Woesearchaeota archaeon]|nr:DUF1573 domain-containing protein [Candidatus Woesearchaeota archaeon]
MGRKDNHIFLAIISVLIILTISMVIYAFPKQKEVYIHGSLMEKPLTKREFYDMFQCPCCGQPVDTDCCGMAVQRKKVLDNLLFNDAPHEKVMIEMVKTFGYDTLMDDSMIDDVKQYILEDAPKNPPKIVFDKETYDFGTISQKGGEIKTSFTITNEGKSDLIIQNMDTSCMCTEASITFEGIEGPRFGMSMHGDNPTGYNLKIPRGKSAVLNVYYDPMAHGTQKNDEQRIRRYVTIISNDPVDFQKKIMINLVQTK